MFRLYWKIFIWFWLMLILTIIAVSWVSISITKKSLITTREKDLLQAFTLAAVTMLENGGEPALLQWSSQLKKSFNIEVFLVNAQTGELVGPMARNSKNISASGKALGKSSAETSVFDQDILKGSDLIVSASITTVDGKQFRLILSQGSSVDLITKIYSKNLLIDLIILILIMSLVSYILSRHLVKPLFKLRKAIQSFASGDLESRPDDKLLHRGDEIGILAKEFSNMASKIQDLIENSKQLLQDVSHELRTPLARLQIASSLIGQQLENKKQTKEGSLKIQEMLIRIDQECGALDELIAEVLSFFRMQMEQGFIIKGELDLVLLLEDLIQRVIYEYQVDTSKIKLEVKLDENNYHYFGQAKLLMRAFENILRNAMKYTNNNRVDITAKYDAKVEAYIIEIRDYGSGVPEHMLDRLFDPFFRVHSDRSQQHGGYGLGLAIAQRAIMAHGGNICAKAHKAGGLVVTISLPVQPSQEVIS
jgi:two-component system, OmpR family, sensor histidine kinase CpxA